MVAVQCMLDEVATDAVFGDGESGGGAEAASTGNAIHWPARLGRSLTRGWIAVCSSDDTDEDVSAIEVGDAGLP